MPDEALADGADLVTFSGDKLLGGPQAGCIVGRADLVARLRRDPLTRAMRPDKVTLAALAATLGIYRAGRAIEEIPVWRMIAEPVDALRAAAEALAGGPRRPAGDRPDRGQPGDRRRWLAARRGAPVHRPRDRRAGPVAGPAHRGPADGRARGHRADRRRRRPARPADGRSRPARDPRRRAAHGRRDGRVGASGAPRP